MSCKDRDCKAAVFHGVGKPLTIQNHAVPRLGDGEVLVRVTCCTICGSDLHTFTGKRPGPTPSILGHEIIGIVDEIGGAASDVSGGKLRIGERVTWSVAASCHACHSCSHGMPQKCESLYKYGHEPLVDRHAPNGGLAEECVLRRGTTIVALPEDVSDEVLCPANCATATVAAAVRVAGSVGGRRVLILGAGMLGLTTAAFSTTQGAAEVYVCDLDANRLNRANLFGATEVASQPRRGDFDLVFEMSGSPDAVELAINHAAIGGIVVLVGSVCPSRHVSVDPERIVRRLLSIHGVHNYRPDDLLTAVSFLAKNYSQFPFQDLVERRFSLDDCGEAFDYAIKHRPIRVSVVPFAKTTITH